MGAWFRGQTGEVLRWFAHLIGSVAFRVHVYSMLLLLLTPAFVPTSSELTVQFPVFSYIVVHKLPQLDMPTLFLVSYNFFNFAAQWARYKHCRQGSLVPACLGNTPQGSVHVGVPMSPEHEPSQIVIVSGINSFSLHKETSVQDRSWSWARTNSMSASPQILMDDFVFFSKDHTTHSRGVVAFETAWLIKWLGTHPSPRCTFHTWMGQENAKAASASQEAIQKWRLNKMRKYYQVLDSESFSSQIRKDIQAPMWKGHNDRYLTPAEFVNRPHSVFVLEWASPSAVFWTLLWLVDRRAWWASP